MFFFSQVEPSWQSYFYYHQVNSQNEAFLADEKFYSSLNSSNTNYSIEKEVESPEDILFLLDDLSQIIYDKGLYRVNKLQVRMKMNFL